MTVTWAANNLSVVVLLGCYSNTIEWLGFKELKLMIVLKAGKPKTKALGNPVSGESPLPASCHLLPVSSPGGRGSGALWRLFLRTPIPFMRALLSQFNLLQRASPPSTITPRGRIPTSFKL